MKKLQLKVLNLGTTEILTRTQLKKVLGGVSRPPDCTNDCQIGSTTYACKSGYKCTSTTCPGDTSVYHNVCTAV